MESTSDPAQFLTPDEIFEDNEGRRAGLILALTKGWTVVIYWYHCIATEDKAKTITEAERLLRFPIPKFHLFQPCQCQKDLTERDNQHQARKCLATKVPQGQWLAVGYRETLRGLHDKNNPVLSREGQSSPLRCDKDNSVFSGEGQSSPLRCDKDNPVLSREGQSSPLRCGKDNPVLPM